MSTNIVKTMDVGVVPFFARFLEQQTTEDPDTPSWPWTFKFPSDTEDT